MKRLLGLSVVAFFLTGLTLAAQEKTTPLYPLKVGNTWTYKVSGGEVSGTIENQYGERQISDGKLSGEDISFTVNIDAGGNQMTFLYKGKVSANEIKFTRERKGGEFGPAKVDFVAKRKG